MMRSYLTAAICCLLLLVSGTSARAASSASASLSISSSSGPGGTNVVMKNTATADGENAGSIISAHGTAVSRNSEASLQHNTLASSHQPSGRTDVQTDTKAHSVGGGTVHGRTDAGAGNDYSASALGQEVALHSERRGGAAAEVSAGVATDDIGSEAAISNTASSVGQGSAAITNEVEGTNAVGHVTGNQHVAAGSDRGGSSDAEAGFLGGFDHFLGTRIHSALKGHTTGEAGVIAGSEGAAVGEDAVSAGKFNLDAQSAGRRRLGRLRPGRRDPSESFGYIYGGTHGGTQNSDSDVGAEGEVYKDGSVGATAEVGTLTQNHDDSVIKAGLAINAEPRQRVRPHPAAPSNDAAPHSLPRNNRGRNHRRRINRQRRRQRQY